MTVSRLREEISSQEFLMWAMYYARMAQREEMARKRQGQKG